MKISSVITFAGASTLAAALASIALAGCGSTDVVAKFANASFAQVVSALPSEPTWSETDASWELSSPEGDKLLLSSDFSRAGTPDAEFAFDAAPFLDAGFDLAKLPASDGIEYELEDGTFMLHFELGPDAFAPDAKKSVEETFADIVKSQRPRIGYHEKLDHYGIKLGNGNMFEWAKDMAANDKDIVFVLNPEPFIASGVDPAKIRGWVFAKVETKDDAGKTIFVDKLLRPLNLR